MKKITLVLILLATLNVSMFGRHLEWDNQEYSTFKGSSYSPELFLMNYLNYEKYYLFGVITLEVTLPIVSDQEFCGETVVGDLVVEGEPDAIFKWYDSISSTSVLAAADEVTSGTYYVSQEIDDEESERVAVKVVVKKIPDVPAALAQIFCLEGKVSDLVIEGTEYDPTAIFSWYGTENAEDVLDSDTKLTSKTYYISQTVDGCESARAAVEVSVVTIAEGVDFKDIKPDEATLFWTDRDGITWEYIVQEIGGTFPTEDTVGKSTATNEVVVTKTFEEDNLEPNTEYEVYVRIVCNDKFGSWEGPYEFRTSCEVSVTPFEETFENSSTTLDCWTILDVANDVNISSWDGVLNTWSDVNGNSYEGDRSMRFKGEYNKNHDDWLISPPVEMNGGNYAVTYYYKTNTYDDSEFAVYLSEGGLEPSDFSTTLVGKKVYKTDKYVKKVVYVTGITGVIHIGWHVTSKSNATIFIDSVSIEEVDCIAPEDTIEITNIESNKASFKWEDDFNTDWEYFVQEAGGGTPVGSGSFTSNKTADVTKTNGVGAGNLEPNTEYEFYVRSECGKDGDKVKVSYWVGPIVFRTPCDKIGVPFWEGFNSTSETLDCWTIVDNDGNKNSWGDNAWHTSTYGQYEGDQVMLMNGNGSPSDDWLISPTFDLDATKIYRLKYHYSAASYYDNVLEVLLSSTGIGLSSFTEVVKAKKVYKTDGYVEVTAFISGVSQANIAWRVTTQGYTNVYLDNVFLEEVKGCPEPLDLGVKDEKESSVTLTWTDAFGATGWEYYIQKPGKGVGEPTTKGIATSKKETVATKDGLGNNLDPNTEYEYYVRTDCGDGTFSIWSGPFKFRTICAVVDLPFWEGFNATSETFYCWNVLNENGDGAKWVKTTYGQYEGSDAMQFYVYDYAETVETDDWLISPTFEFKKDKMYRLKYHYRVSTYYDSNTFEVLASNTGRKPADFKKEVVAGETYFNGDYLEKKTFISDFGGDVSIAWHVYEPGSKEIFIDNVFVEEVEGCPEPLNLGVKDIDIKEAVILWTDAFGATEWEYYVQADGAGVPTGTGTSTKKKENKVTTEQDGTSLEPNTEYEYYVRTVCGNGEYSIWTGPFKFITACDVYQAPFWEGFNTDSKTTRCWTVLDVNEDGDDYNGKWRVYNYNQYEGDQLMYYYSYNSSHDDWLVSPTIEMDAGMYVLKYHYQASTYYTPDFEVMLSKNGVDPEEFKMELLAKATYNNGSYKEAVVFFSGVNADANIGWHVIKEGGGAELSIDNVFIKKVETCPEPYYVTITGETSTTIDLEWEQVGGVTEWEIIVVEYGEDETATPVKKVSVTGDPKTTITGLSEGGGYTIYVRAKCSGSGDTYSDWSTPKSGGTTVGANDDCDGAITIPVNSGKECVVSVGGSLLGATASTTATPNCFYGVNKDVWFEFTATSSIHALSLEDLISMSGQYINLNVAVYDQPCGAITNTSLACFNLNPTTNFRVFKDLIPGQKYYVRIGSTNAITDYLFRLCITSPTYLLTSESGDEYTVEELVKDVLVLTDCDLVSNITYTTGTDFGEANGIGYFNSNGTDFGFQEGVVLATNGVRYTGGPGGGEEGYDTTRWLGDPDLQELLEEMGRPNQNHNASILEFDFVPIVDTLRFDFIFVSNEYGPSYQCNYSDVFAFFLTDLTTNEVTNLAVIPGTDIPVSVTTIRDAAYQGSQTCGSTNEEYFDKYYGQNGLPRRDNPINYAGMTVPLTAQSAVIPGRKYHIKLAIADYSDSGVNSAVFLNGGSFDLGNLDLGADLLVETGTALCSDDTKTIKSGVATEGTEISWYKDEVLMPGETEPDLEIDESGTYKVVVLYTDINCAITGEITAEIFPPISNVVFKPEPIHVCRYSLSKQLIDLSASELAMFESVEREDYMTSYHVSEDDAKSGSNEIDTDFDFETKQSIVLYVRVVDERTKCYEVFELPIVLEKGEEPESREDVVVCAEYTLPSLTADQFYYTESGGVGIEYKAGDILDTAGEHVIYVLQLNSEEGCYEETSYKVSVTEAVKADVFESVAMSCEIYTLLPLSPNNKYFTEAGGKGIELVAGTPIPLARTIYVYASSEDGLCVDESSFTVEYSDCPIQKGISPNGDGLNDRFDLSNHGVQSLKIYNRYGVEVYSYGSSYLDQWEGQDASGNKLPDGTYYYVVTAHDKVRTGWVQINR